MKLTYFLAIMIAINVFLWLMNVSITNINPNAPVYYTSSGTFIGQYDTGNYTLNQSIKGELPSTTGSISPTTGNFFTDIFSTIKNWFLSIPGFKYLDGIANAVPRFLSGVGLPAEISFALGVFWQSIAVFLFIMFLRGIAE